MRRGRGREGATVGAATTAVTVPSMWLAAAGRGIAGLRAADRRRVYPRVMADEPVKRHPVAWAIVGIVAVLVALILLLGFTPLLDDDLESRPAPAADYDEAMQRAEVLLAADGPAINPRCVSQVLSHGERVEQSVVLLHGYTNCPQQYSVMAQTYFDAGYNVVVPRLPSHGYADRMTDALSDLEPGGLTALADEAVDIAAGLGERVTVVGLSAGGTLAAWLAGERDDVAEAALMAPLMVPKVLPEFTVGPVARFSSFLPDIYLWWDGELQEELASPPYAYPRYSVHSLGALLAVGRRAQGDVDRSQDLERLLIVTNENDAAVSNKAVEEVAENLEGHTIQRVNHVFAEELGYRHDIVDPEGENAADLPDIYATLGPLLGIPELADDLVAASGAE
jgi:pimeloyl-ACP methyl ester carboxylesterase